MAVGGVGALMLLFPPVLYPPDRRCYAGNFLFIFDMGKCQIDVAQLFAQWFGVLVVAGIAILLTVDVRK